MKLQKKFTRKYKEKNYYKYVVGIPKYILDEAGLSGDEIMDITAEKNKIILTKK